MSEKAQSPRRRLLCMHKITGYILPDSYFCLAKSACDTDNNPSAKIIMTILQSNAVHKEQDKQRKKTGEFPEVTHTKVFLFRCSVSHLLISNSIMRPECSCELIVKLFLPLLIRRLECYHIMQI
jgi:hypothetical protein